MAKIIGLPKLSPTMDEGTLVSWQKKEGDTVDVDDLLAEVETDKATMEFRSFDKGVLLKILVPEGETLAPDTPVAIIGQTGEDISKLVAESAQATPQTPQPSAAESAPARSTNGQGESAAAAAPQSSAAPLPSAAAPDPVALAADGRVLASPVVRRIAREENVDLRQVNGSGPHGRVVKRDIESFLESGGARISGTALALGPARETRVEKVSQMRKTIARRLTESKRDVPHYYLTIDVDVAPMMAVRKTINAELEKAGEKISLNDMILKAAAVALKRSPGVNASFRGDAIHYHGRVDISVAVAIPEGLITPVIRNADMKGLAEIGREVRELAGRAREKKLQPEEFTDGTFSISNLGMFGIEEFTAVINPPEGAILAVGTIREEPVVKNGQVVPGRRMRMTMSCDHRVIDGAVGAEFLAVLKRLLESPATMLM